MKISLYLTCFALHYYLIDSAQPYFPSQIVFSPDNNKTIFAIDEMNQRAYKTVTYGATVRETSYLMKNFPYTIPDSPQSKYYVQLLVDTPSNSCQYATFWKYGGSTFNSFPLHWQLNASSIQVDNYIKFKYEMLHSTDSSTDEDYWYSNVTCQVYGGAVYPCEEIYFIKNTQIPLRFTEVVRRGWFLVQLTTSYNVISMRKPDEKLFDSIPKTWPDSCRDYSLGLLYYPQRTKILVNEKAQVQVWLIAPPHRINGSDTVTIHWKSDEFSKKRQTLTITRVKDGPKTNLIPSFHGGGFDHVTAAIYPIFIE
ncbi:unnamed protein product [Rotaria sordida]|uniref:Uncharacterized protein n=1 Tax=Rotaria sordida TaxID=392033 RepID=A0A815YDE4_9BILA|nr:unnamed protein product [Rotaria sordida]